jgi:hypothetical protein
LKKNNKEFAESIVFGKEGQEMAAEITGNISLFSLFCLTSNEKCSL